MAGIFDYLSWRGDLSFSQSPLNPVDALIFCQLSYLPFDNMVPAPGSGRRSRARAAGDSHGAGSRARDADFPCGISVCAAAQIFAKKREKNALDGYVIFKDDPELLETLGRSSRFKDCLLHSFVNHVDEAQEKQFSAVCIDTGAFNFIAYRGTDVTLVGWKEDLNMSFCDTVPSQLEAVAYLEAAAKNTCGTLLIGGHSKGGNLAVYAASSCSKRTGRRIGSIYSFDAPGFQRKLISGDGFRQMRDRINLYIPQSSVVGLLFEHGKDFIVIKSTQSGLLQHELYTWELTYNDMVRLDEFTQHNRFVDKTLKDWIGSLDYAQRREFSEALFTILNATRAKSFVDMGSDWFKAASKMIQTLGNVDRSTKKVIRKTIAALFKAARKNFDALLK